MEIDKINLNGVEYNLGLEKYISFIKPAEIIAQNHQLTLTVDELERWYNAEKPDYTFFTFTSNNRQLQLYTSRCNSCPQRIVYHLDSVRAGLSKEDFNELNELYGISCTGSDVITIYYGN